MVADLNQTFPCDGDQFIMQVLIRSGFSNKMLPCLNQVRVCQQLLFLSDILTASGNKKQPRSAITPTPGEAWSNMTWPNEHPTDSDFQMWRRAILSICPSQSNSTRVGRFMGPPYRIWRWTWNGKDSTLHHLRADSIMEDVFVSRRKPNRFHHSHSQPNSHLNTICLVESSWVGKAGI